MLPSMSHINIEIKTRCDDPERIKSILESEGADFKGIDHQIDTYFKIPHGRLKLREGNIERNLIYYERENEQGPKQSNVTLFPVPPDSSLKDILTQSLGVLVVVNKQREIYFIDNVKFHIDQVKQLGSFVEIEAIDKTGNRGRERLMEQCQYYLKLLGVNENDLQPQSYSDLLLAS